MHARTTAAVAVMLALSGCESSSRFSDDAVTDSAEPDTTSDVTTDTALDAVPDGLPDTEADVLPDTPDDTGDDVPVDVPVDLVEDPPPDTVTDTLPDTAIDSIADTSTDGPPVRPGSECAYPVDLTGLGTWTGHLSDYGNAWSGSGSCDTANGREIWFVATVQPGDLLAVSEIGSTDVVLHRVASCGTTSCLWSSDMVESFDYLNDSSSPVTVILVVEAYFESETGVVTLSVANGPPLPGSSCDDALDIGALRSWTGDYGDYANLWEAPSGCGSGAGPEVWFTATMAAGQIFRLEETTSTDVVIALLDSCASATCTEYHDLDEALAIYNGSGAARTLTFVVEAYFGDEDGPVSLEQGSLAPFPGSMCSRAIDVTSASTWSGDLDDFVNLWEPPSGCGYANGAEIWFVASVPPGNTFTLTETTGTDVVIERLATCSSGSCLDYWDFTESASIANTGLSTLTVTLLVEGYSSSGGPVSLVITNTHP